jgi:hypothetical protein
MVEKVDFKMGGDKPYKEIFDKNVSFIIHILKYHKLPRSVFKVLKKPLFVPQVPAWSKFGSLFLPKS